MNRVANKMLNLRINFTSGVASLMIFVVALACTGCIGSTLLHDENDQPLGEFGDLHSVPDKPRLPDKQELLHTRKLLEQDLKVKTVMNP